MVRTKSEIGRRAVFPYKGVPLLLIVPLPIRQIEVALEASVRGQVGKGKVRVRVALEASMRGRYGYASNHMRSYRGVCFETASSPGPRVQPPFGGEASTLSNLGQTNEPQVAVSEEVWALAGNSLMLDGYRVKPKGVVDSDQSSGLSSDITDGSAGDKPNQPFIVKVG